MNDVGPERERFGMAHVRELNIELDLPRQGVSLLQLTWEDEPGTVP